MCVHHSHRPPKQKHTHTHTKVGSFNGLGYLKMPLHTAQKNPHSYWSRILPATIAFEMALNQACRNRFNPPPKRPSRAALGGGPET